MEHDGNSVARGGNLTARMSLWVIPFAIAVTMCVALTGVASAQGDVVAEAGPNLRVDEGVTVELNGTGSTGDILSYTWNFTYDDEPVVLEGDIVQFTFERSGVYFVTLNVTGHNATWDTDRMTVTIVNVPTWLEAYAWSILKWTTIGLAVAWIASFVLRKYMRDKMLLTSSDVEKMKIQWKNAKKTWKIFRSNRLGFFGFSVLIGFVIVATAAPILSTVSNPDNPDNYENNHISDGWVNPLPPSWDPSPYTGQRHIWGTDVFGRDVYSMTLFGTRASLEVGMVATLISVAMGASIGLAAGYFGRVTDEVLMRLTDFFLVIPWFPLMIVMMAILGREFIWVVLVIGITSWPSTARIVRSQVLTIKERQFIERARAVGAGSGQIIKKHILPNVLPLIFANTVLLISLAIFSAAFLDFFGLGDPTVISWGLMLESAYSFNAYTTGAWWWIFAPGAAIIIMVLAFSLVGYALDDVLNPKLRRR
jgi:peptide/nickel transport system permease protein